jgi:hypothetical protein
MNYSPTPFSIESSNLYSKTLSFIFVAYCTFPFSPFLSFYFSIIIILSSDPKVRFFVYPLLSLSASIIAISRGLFESVNDDFETYYENFLSIFNNDFDIFYDFGIEIGLPAFNYILGFLLGSLKPRTLLFIYVFSQFCFILYILEMFVKRYSLYSKANLFIFCFFAFFPFLAQTLFVRQYFAILFVFAAILHKNNKGKVALIICASFFHLSAIVLFIIHMYFTYISGRRWLFNLLTFILSFIVVSFVFSYFSGVAKIRAWFILDETFTLTDFLIYYKYIIIILLLSIFTLSDIAIKSKKYCLSLLGFAFVIDYHIPYISPRALLPAFCFSGAILFIIVSEYKKKANLLLFITPCLVFLSISKAFTVVHGSGEYQLFNAFPFYSLEPFYFIDSLFLADTQRNR